MLVFVFIHVTDYFLDPNDDIFNSDACFVIFELLSPRCKTVASM